jgi:hypothetical protein
MKVYHASSDKVEVNGETVYAIVDGMGAFKSQAIAILSENGIEDPKPGHWYNQQAWLNSFKKISEKIGNSTLFNIGLKIPANAIFPPEINDVHKALSSIDIAYHLNHRGGEIGHYSYEKTGNNSCKMICDNPYPDDFDKGIISAMCRKFVKNRMSISVKIAEGPAWRDKGGDKSTYIVAWK